MTVLFCDLVGSTARADGADPEDVQATLGPYHARLRTELERYGATVEKFIGDAVMAVFGTPTAHEDDAERGVRAGLRILAAIGELNAARPGLDLEVRIGVASGEGLVRLGARPELGQGIVVGDVVNTAARLQTAAPPGGLVVGELTHRLTVDDFDYQALAPVTVKGKAGPLAVWQAAGTRARIAAEVLSAPATPFVGRAEELAALRSALGRTVRERAVQLVTITGEPGVGKSRLVRELAGVADEAPELISWRQGNCLPYGDGVTFWALGEIIKAEAGILESDGEVAARAKLTTAVEAVTAEDRAWLIARLGPLVGLTGETGVSAAQEESFTAWRRFLEAAAAERPLVVVVEDAQWADPALLGFVEHLVDWAEGVALLVVVTARPELYAHAPAWGGGKRNATTLALRPLADAETAQLLAALLDAAVLPAEAQAALLERAGGNPLYAEQFVRLITEQGLLTRRGRVVELSRAGDLPLPEAVSALIAARLDTLPAGHKLLLADAAVLGRVFWSGGLLALGERDAAEVRTALRDLARAELVRRVPNSTVAGQDEYAFWHVLVRDVAYGSLPRKVRAARHLAAARWLEQLAGDRVADYAELLAHHYLTALERTRDSGDKAGADALAEPAARYLVMAGDLSMELDPEVAAGHYDRAAGLLPVTGKGRPAILIKAGRANFERGQLPEAEDLLREAIAGYQTQHDVAGPARRHPGLPSWPETAATPPRPGGCWSARSHCWNRRHPADRSPKHTHRARCTTSWPAAPSRRSPRPARPWPSSSSHPSREPGRWRRGAGRESRSATSGGSRMPGRRSGSLGPWRCPSRSPPSSGTWPSTNGSSKGRWPRWPPTGKAGTWRSATAAWVPAQPTGPRASALCLTWVNGMSCWPGHSSCARHWRPREPATPWPRWSPTGRLSCCCGARAQRPGR